MKFFSLSQIITFSLLGSLFQSSQAGIVFSKVSATGSILPDEASQWSCVKHNSSGLIWELKTSSNKDLVYKLNERDSFIQQINQQGLCGYRDWRLPTIKELFAISNNDISNNDNLKIDARYFPNTHKIRRPSRRFDIADHSDYWSSDNVNNNGEADAWGFDFRQLALRQGYGSSLYLRLVRGEPVYDKFDYIKLDREGKELSNSASNWQCVKDRNSQLIWEVKNTSNLNQRFSFNAITSYQQQLNQQQYCGQSNWRLPELEDLISIVDHNKQNPAIKTAWFPNTLSNSIYWAQSINNSGEKQAWYISFEKGYMQAGTPGLFGEQSSQSLRLVSGHSMKERDLVDDSIAAMYIAYFKRAPDFDGYRYWQNQSDLQGGKTALLGISSAFAQTEQFSIDYPPSLSTRDFVSRVYNNILSRDADSGGLNYWTNRIDNDGIKPYQFIVEYISAVLNFIPSSDFTDTDNASATLAQSILKNKISAAKYFTEQLTSQSNGAPGSRAYNASIEVLSEIDESENSVNQARAKADSYQNQL